MMPWQDARFSAASLSHLRHQRPISLPHTALPTLFVLVDFVIILAASVVSGAAYHQIFYDRFGDAQLSLGVGLVTAALFIAATHAQGLYRGLRPLRLRQHFKAATLMWTLVFAGLACLLFLLKMGDVFSRGALIGFFATGLPALLTWRLALKRLQLKLAIAGTLSGPRIVVLAENDGRDMGGLLQRFERYGCRLSRLVFLPPDGLSEKVTEEKTLAALQTVIRHVRERNIDEIIVVASWEKFLKTEMIQAYLRMVPLPVKLIADSDLARALSYEACDAVGGRALLLKPAALGLAQRMSKRLFDIVVSVILLICLLPLIAIVAFLIKLDSSGPVFFRQWRGGYNGRRFRIFKFRSMRVQEDGTTIHQARKSDPRVTPVGRLLRKTSIDELPQLINVLLGDMSLVGPRPHAIAHDREYAEVIAPYPERHNVKPGITGLAQVSGCRGETSKIGLMERRVSHDLIYIEQWSMLLDCWIVLKTLREVIAPRNAH